MKIEFGGANLHLMRKTTDVCVHEQNKVSFVVQADTSVQPFLAKIKLVSMYPGSENSHYTNISSDKKSNEKA